MSKDEQPQAMQLDLAPEILGDILKNARKDDNKTQLSLGKSPVSPTSGSVCLTSSD